MNVMIKKLLQGQAVEWQTLGEVVKLEKGKQLNKELLFESGLYPAYNGGVSYSGFTDIYNYEENTIIISQGGASAGFVNFVTTKFYANAHCYVVLPKNEMVENRFIYHFLKLNQEKMMTKQHGAGIPALRTNEILTLKIPIPPLSVQSQIVQILDTFTELTAELSMRQKQYQYYRDFLLSEHELAKVGFEWKTLGEVGELVRGNGLTKKDLTDDGVPAIHYGQIYTRYGLSTEKTLSFVSTELAKRLRKVDTGDVVITNTSENLADVGKSLVYLGKEQAVTGGHATIFKPNKQIILGKYFAYFTQTDNFATQKRKYAKGTKVIDVSTNDMAKLKIPIPPLSVQSQIVAILDTFDTLVNSISEGLPKEIKLRQKQYEYYRERLLAF
ncbi:restriction endonuclease subunit S [Moraxella catarrhalis]|uniref:restriction endonuclease subunit S n=1 Tax=Moraxella catarrhalis TaxID=480 RepID=UPI0007E33761|nr:restriction endonuclease subunit S [Moraxella catarrhalis]OAV15666.1 Type I restriction-modification system, specificity subunit S [Moraxella catarrhalis]